MAKATEEKVFYFNEGKYKGTYITIYVIAILVWIAALIYFIIRYGSVGSSVGVFSFYLILSIYNFRRALKSGETNRVSFFDDDNTLLAQVILNNSRYDISYDIKKVYSVKRKLFSIKVVGEIEGRKVNLRKGHIVTFSTDRMRIPARFFWMDEILERLEGLRTEPKTTGELSKPKSGAESRAERRDFKRKLRQSLKREQPLTKSTAESRTEIKQFNKKLRQSYRREQD